MRVIAADDLHARYYLPTGGRFVSVDPVGGEVGGSQSWNRYSYVGNKPVLLSDPEGRVEGIGFDALNRVPGPTS